MPDKTYQLLNRVTYGPRQKDIQRVQKEGWETYILDQLNPGEEPEKLNHKIREGNFDWQFEMNGKTTQSRSKLEFYDLSIAQIWKRLTIDKGQQTKYDLRRPFYETLIISWLKILHSPWQLRELMVEFWHNHFTVSVDVEDGIAGCYAAYDREAIRPNALGNFRNMLEAVTKSPAMLHYLDNAVSRASPANENFARELFELHTLGADNYYNHLYDDWKKVPGALDGKAEGYIDEDVYEAARAFTGWTVAYSPPGDIPKPVPNSGEFYYYDPWHDPYKKRVLGVEFKSQRGPMEDGLQVLDLVGYHPKTAHFLCTKLCRWWVADEPPESIVEKAVNTWMQFQQSPHQIRETLKTILLSEEFEAHLGQKIKRPNHLVFAFVRMTGADLTPNESVFWWIRKMGYHQFTSPFPTGNPDGAAYWLNSDAMLKRWQSFPELEKYGTEEGFFHWDVLKEIPNEIRNVNQLIDHWSQRLLDTSLPQKVRSMLKEIFLKDLPKGSVPALKSQNPQILAFKVKQLVRLICMSPEFQKR